jgi:hypothetical protein
MENAASGQEPQRSSVFQRLAGGKSADHDQKAPPPAGQEPRTIEESQAYGFLRGVREQAVHLVLQPRQGEERARNYTLLTDIIWLNLGTEDARAQGILLLFSDGVEVLILGRNLEKIKEHLHWHQVTRITEMGEDNGRFLPDEATVVYAIRIADPKRQQAKAPGGRSDG